MSDRSNPWYMLLPLGLVIVLALGWSAFWYVSFTSIKQSYQEWAERAKRSGLSLECAEQSWGGYPFRVEMSCDAAHFSRIGTGTDMIITSRNITAVTQVYTPDLVVIQFTGPSSLDVNRARGGVSISGAHAPAYASLKFTDKTPAELSVLIENLNGTLLAGGARKAGRLTAERINLHGRFANKPQNGKVSYDVAAVASAFSYDGPQRDPIDGGPISFDSLAFSANVTDVPYPWPDILGETVSGWAQNGGTLNVSQLDLTRSPIRASMSGDLKADEQGRLDGELKAKIVNLDKVLDRLVSVGKLSRSQASLAKNMFQLLSGGGGNGGVSTELVVKQSSIYLGPFKIGEFAPLF